MAGAFDGEMAMAATPLLMRSSTIWTSPVSSALEAGPVYRHVYSDFGFSLFHSAQPSPSTVKNGLSRPLTTTASVFFCAIAEPLSASESKTTPSSSVLFMTPSSSVGRFSAYNNIPGRLPALVQRAERPHVATSRDESSLPRHVSKRTKQRRAAMPSSRDPPARPWAHRVRALDHGLGAPAERGARRGCRCGSRAPAHDRARIFSASPTSRARSRATCRSAAPLTVGDASSAVRTVKQITALTWS